MDADRPLIAFLATQGAAPNALRTATRSLQELGFRVDVLDPSDADPSVISHYSGLALPAVKRSRSAANPRLARLIDAMHAARKPVFHVSVGGETSARRDFSTVRLGWKALLADTWRNWNFNDAPRLGASLAYYATLSFAPLLVLIVCITGIFFKRTIIQSGLLWQVQVFMGEAGASMVRSVLDHSKVSTGIVAGTLGIIVLLLGASGVFLELRDSLDTVWGVTPPYGSGLVSLLRARASAFLAILGTGLLLCVSFLLSAVLATPLRFMLNILPAEPYVTETVNVCLSLVVMAVIFALIFRAIPDIDVAWGDVWIGGIVTSVLFNIGRAIIGLYLTNASIGSPYAAAGSVIIFLTWVYYSAQIFLFGAEFTHVYAMRHGSYSKNRRDVGVRRLRPAASPRGH